MQSIDDNLLSSPLKLLKMCASDFILRLISYYVSPSYSGEFVITLNDEQLKRLEQLPDLLERNNGTLSGVDVVLSGDLHTCAHNALDIFRRLSNNSKSTSCGKRVIFMLTDEEVLKLIDNDQWTKQTCQVVLTPMEQGVRLDASESIYPLLDSCLFPEPISDEFISGSWYSVELISFRSIFEIILKPRCRHLKNLQFDDILERICSNRPLSDISEDPGDVTIAVKHNDRWYRAKVMSTGRFSLIDTGEVIDRCPFVRVSDGVLERWPAFVRDCMLDKVEPPSGDEDWSSESNQVLKKLIDKASTTLKCRCNRVVPFEGVNVCLVDLKYDGCEDVASAFVETGFACSF